MSAAASDQTESNGVQEESGAGSGKSNGHVTTPPLDDVTPTAFEVPGTILPGANEQLIQDSLQFIQAGAPQGGGLHMPYSTFTSGDGGSWTTVMDPSMMAGFGFPGSNLMPGQYIVGSEMIWSQDPLANPLLMGYQLLNPVAMEQATNVPMDQTVPNSVDSVGQIGPAFGSMALNGGSIQGIVPVGPAAMIPSTPGTPGGVDSSISVPPTSSTQVQSSAPQPEKPKSWAAIASQPAKPRPPPPPKQQLQPDLSTVESSKKFPNPSSRQAPSQPQKGQTVSASGGTGESSTPKNAVSRKSGLGSGPQAGVQPSRNKSQSDIVGKLHSQNKYNPSEMTVNLTNARYFVIKSYAEDDIHRSIKYSIWTSTEHGNRRLDQAFKEQKGKPVFLFYSVNGSGHFCGMAQMKSEVDFHTITGIWAQDKWKGRFDVKWLYVKDVPNSQLRHIRLENNENKPVTNSRDTQEIPSDKGKQVVKIVHTYLHTTSIFDDFEHYEKKQEEDGQKKK